MKNILLKLIIICCFIATSSSMSYSKDVSDLNNIDTNKVGKFVIRNEFPENYSIFNLKIKRYELLDGFMIYSINDKNYIPLSDFTYALDFPTTINPEKGISSGWFIEEENEFLMDLSKGNIKVRDVNINLTQEDVHLYDSEIFIEEEMLEKIFNLNLNIDNEKSSLIVNSDRTLPVEEKIIRYKSYKNISSPNKSTSLNIDEDKVLKNNDAFTVPATDFSLGYNYRKNEDTGAGDSETRKGFTTSIYGGGRLFDFNNKFNYYSDSDTDKSYLKFNLSEYYPSESSKVKFLEMGDVSAYRSPIISSGGIGRGVQLTSFDHLESSDKKTVDIIGNMPFGWEAELSRNGTIFGFQSESKDGQYKFLSQPVNLGLNVFKITLYGPFGQKEEKEKIVYISPTAVEEGEMGFKLSVLQKNLDLFNLEEKEVSSDKILLETEYGITDNLSTVFGFSSKMFNDQTSATERLEEENIFLTGLKANISSSALGLYVAQGLESSNTAYQTYFETKLLNLNFLAEYNDFGGLKTEESFLSTEYVDTLSELRIGGAINLGLKRLPFWVTYREGRTEDDKMEKELSGNISMKILRKLNFTYEISQRNTFLGQEKNYGIFRLSSDYFNSNIRAELAVDNKYNELSYNNISIDLGLSKTVNASLRWQHKYKSQSYVESSDTFSVSLSKNYSFGILSFVSQLTDSDDYSFGLKYNFGIRRNPTTKKYVSYNNNVSNTSAISANIFLDENENNIFDEGEEAIQDVSMKYNGTLKEETTDENGNVFLSNIGAYKVGFLNIDEQTLPDISMVANKKNIAVRGKPGSWIELDYPVINAGMVDGSIYSRANGKLRSKKGIKLSLLKKDSPKSYETMSDMDGYFTFENVTKGRYQVFLDNAQLKDLNLRLKKPRVFSVDNENLFQTLENLVLVDGYRPQKKMFDTEVIAKSPKPSKYKTIKGKTTCKTTGCNKKLGGIRVSLLKEGLLFDYTIIGKDGTFKFDNILDGEYEVRLFSMDLIKRGLSQETSSLSINKKDLEKDMNINIKMKLEDTFQDEKLESFILKDKMEKIEKLKKKNNTFIIGRIESSDENPISTEGIKVNLYKDDKLVKETFSDNFGLYSFDKLETGDYRIDIDSGQLEKIGIKVNSIDRTVNINSDKLYLEIPNIGI